MDFGGNCSSGGEEGPVYGIEEVKLGGRDRERSRLDGVGGGNVKEVGAGV